MREILVATSNPHKLREIRQVLEPLGITVRGLDSIDADVPEPIEDGLTFADNARLKAMHYARHTGQICLADDSGLEVDALNGAPGVLSARYAGVDGSREERDRANNERLLRELDAMPGADRSARFVCAMCVADPRGIILAEAEGFFEGVIGTEPRGKNGFGYDPLLYLPEEGRTAAELSPEEKNARSHRGQAARRIAELIARAR